MRIISGDSTSTSLYISLARYSRFFRFFHLTFLRYLKKNCYSYRILNKVLVHENDLTNCREFLRKTSKSEDNSQIEILRQRIYKQEVLDIFKIFVFSRTST